MPRTCRIQLVIPNPLHPPDPVKFTCNLEKGHADSGHTERGRIKLPGGQVQTYSMIWFNEAEAEVWRA